MPLLLTENGAKFGKSAGAPIWLNPGRTSPFHLYQYTIRRPDAELERLLKFLTFLPLGEIESTLRKHEKRPESRYAQTKLAEHVTTLVHGEDALRQAQASSDVLYHNNVSALAAMQQDEARKLFQQADFIQKLYQPGITLLGTYVRYRRDFFSSFAIGMRTYIIMG